MMSAKLPARPEQAQLLRFINLWFGARVSLKLGLRGERVTQTAFSWVTSFNQGGRGALAGRQDEQVGPRIDDFLCLWV